MVNSPSSPRLVILPFTLTDAPGEARPATWSRLFLSTVSSQEARTPQEAAFRSAAAWSARGEVLAGAVVVA